ncbi:hypothetical protein GALMADRAFT_144703 [Galerina marginata CBS 339.88]|uniref:Uncharacterized protein n=1 Tax=Galerina marginata (strain CBS 339.88) TaxID=685588 RepID=A0A067SRT3_GALM3|nr:hypothetical protein GALMADRAFT_144703 [Galerina marginata CBS 339.88]
MLIPRNTTTPPVLLTRELKEGSPWKVVIFLTVTISGICLIIAMGTLWRKWLDRRAARARERRRLEAVHAPEAPDTNPSGGTMLLASTNPGTTEPLETLTHPRYRYDGAPSPPPAYNSLVPNVQPSAPPDASSVPAAHISSSNSPRQPISVHLQEGGQIKKLNPNC